MLLLLRFPGRFYLAYTHSCRPFWTFWTHTAEMARNVNQPGRADRFDPSYRGTTTQKQKAGHPKKKIMKKNNNKGGCKQTNKQMVFLLMFPRLGVT